MLIRLMAGNVFHSAGIKISFSSTTWSGRFHKIGLHGHEILGYFVESFKVLCDFLFYWVCLPGLLLYRDNIMLVALVVTKADVGAHEGFWAIMHTTRTGWFMLLEGFF